MTMNTQCRITLQRIIPCCLPKKKLVSSNKDRYSITTNCYMVQRFKFIWDLQLCDNFHFQTVHIVEYSSYSYFVCGVHRCLEQAGATLHKSIGSPHLATMHPSYRHWDNKNQGKMKTGQGGWGSYVIARPWFSIN